MARVWADSSLSGSELLMLLAIADFADDDGNAYPAVPTLAAKCRTTPRHANRLLCALRDSGELEIRINEGPRGTNRYRVRFEGMTAASPLTNRSPLTPKSPTPDLQVPKPLTPTSDEPSLNHQEPPKRKRAKGALTSLPEGFSISERVRAWADAKGFTPHLEAHLEHFVGTVRASGRKYLDWDDALMNYVRGDYGDVRKKASGGSAIRRSPLHADEQFRGAQ